MEKKNWNTLLAEAGRCMFIMKTRKMHRDKENEDDDD